MIISCMVGFGVTAGAADTVKYLDMDLNTMQLVECETSKYSNMTNATGPVVLEYGTYYVSG